MSNKQKEKQHIKVNLIESIDNQMQQTAPKKSAIDKVEITNVINKDMLIVISGVILASYIKKKLRNRPPDLTNV